jgi:hypothetical protein
MTTEFFITDYFYNLFEEKYEKIICENEFLISCPFSPKNVYSRLAYFYGTPDEIIDKIDSVLNNINLFILAYYCNSIKIDDNINYYYKHKKIILGGKVCDNELSIFQS